MKHIIAGLSPLERKIIPYLHLTLKEIQKKTALDETSVLRALRFLETKDLVKIHTRRKVIVDLGVNGIYYKRNGLPERKLLHAVEKKNHLSLEEAKKISALSENEFKAALGALKNKAFITLTNGKLSLQASREELTRKSPEEKLLEQLPKEKDTFNDEERYALDNLSKRKEIINYTELKEITLEITEQGKHLQKEDLTRELIEEITPELIKSPDKKEFRRYNIVASVPKIYGGRKHFVTQAREYAKRIWIELGFREMEGPIVDSSFWVFDALFTAQDHSVRELQDSFYLKGKYGDLPEGKLLTQVKEAHEKGIAGSRGWNYTWNEAEAQKIVMRTHTTSLSARTLASLKEKDIPAKFFAIGKAFRNETIDWSHGIEFYQTEGIVVDKNATLRNLFGYLQQFYKKMGFEKIRFRPSFFPYTEPSVEIDVFHAERQQWLELGGAGILRPEVTTPLLGKPVPVLAWGQGLDRTIMDFYAIKDLRELYSNDIRILRNKKIWTR